jgi:hypothetical protein
VHCSAVNGQSYTVRFLLLVLLRLTRKRRIRLGIAKATPALKKKGFALLGCAQ